MASRIEDYALIGDCQAAALVSREGSIDWLCLPRFDSDACFAALLGTPENGRWLITPAEPVRANGRRYRDGSLILETDFKTDGGEVTLIDFMPPRNKEPDVVRRVVGRKGRVRMRMELIIRFEYGAMIPWVRRFDGGLVAVAGPDAIHVRSSDVELRGENFHTVAEFDVEEGQTVSFVLAWHPSHKAIPPDFDIDLDLARAEAWWRDWTSQCTYQGEWKEHVVRSLTVLKALTYAPTGGIVAAPTTSLPEKIGGVRNWDYRYCWVRDAAFTLYAMMLGGYVDEARAWRDWMIRAVAGKPSQIQAMYGIAGERRLTELELDWLPGYEDSRPVRIGNGAYEQFQLDVFGSVIGALHVARRAGLPPDRDGWNLQLALLEHLEDVWQVPDEGIWEIRGEPQHFTYSKIMAWVAMNSAVDAVENFGLTGPLKRWKQLRDQMHAEICANGFDSNIGAFTQSYGSSELDASLLIMPLVGFLPATDPRVRGTVEAIERNLVRDGFVDRYSTHSGIDGLPPGEGAFLLCTFWLADNLAMMGRYDDARELFERLLNLQNDVGLLAEEYDPESKRMVGNFPQAFSHVALINTANILTRYGGLPGDLAETEQMTKS